MRPPRPSNRNRTRRRRGRPSARHSRVTTSREPLNMPNTLILFTGTTRFRHIKSNISTIRTNRSRQRRSISKIFRPLRRKFLSTGLRTTNLLNLTSTIMITLSIQGMPRHGNRQMTRLMQGTSTIRTNHGLTKINNQSRRGNRKRNRRVLRQSITRVRRLLNHRIVPPRRITRRHTNTMRHHTLIKIRRRSRRIIRRRRR